MLRSGRRPLAGFVLFAAFASASTPSQATLCSYQILKPLSDEEELYVWQQAAIVVSGTAISASLPGECPQKWGGLRVKVDAVYKGDAPRLLTACSYSIFDIGPDPGEHGIFAISAYRGGYRLADSCINVVIADITEDLGKQPHPPSTRPGQSDAR